MADVFDDVFLDGPENVFLRVFEDGAPASDPSLRRSQLLPGDSRRPLSVQPDTRRASRSSGDSRRPLPLDPV